MEGFEFLQEPKVILNTICCFGFILGFLASGFTIIIDVFYDYLFSKIRSKRNKDKELQKKEK